MNRRKLLAKLLQGSLHNVDLPDFIHLVEGFGFRLARTRGSHHIFAHPLIPELLNLQDVRGEPKPYQIRQLLRLVERYNLKIGNDE